MSASEPIGIGVVGTGNWARSFWREARESKQVRLVACWNRTRERAEKFAEEFGGEVSASIEELAARDDIAAIANFAANAYRMEPTRIAAEAGKHVFVDKPIANTIEEGAAMMKICREAGVKLMVGHSSRYGAEARALKRVLDSGRLGELVMVEANSSHSGGTRLSDDKWRWHWEEAPGGPLMQLSVHTFDTLHYLVGPTKRVTALCTKDILPSEIEDVFLTLLEFESGLLAYVGTNYVAPPVHFARFYGRKENVYAERGKLTHVIPTDPWTTETKESEVPPINGFAAEMDELARAIRADDEPETGGPEAMLALAVVWACIESTRQQRPMEVREVLGESAALVM